MKKQDTNTLMLGIILLLILFLGIFFMFRWGFIVKEDDKWTFNCPMSDDSNSDANGSGVSADESNEESSEPTCADTDGGDNIYVFGTCTDNEGTVDSDECPQGDGTEYISEAYCLDGGCYGLSKPCPDEYWCWAGECVKYAETERACTSIWNPSQSECSIYGVCESGFSCVYIQADLQFPERCECMPI